MEATGGYLDNQFQASITGVSTNSGQSALETFVPLIGPNFDGHDFIKQAFEKGAAISLCNEDKRIKVNELLGENIIFVENTQSALLKLSTYYRQLF